MDLFGLDILVIMMIVGITEKVKEFVTFKVKSLYLVFPFVLACVASLKLTVPFSGVEYLWTAFMYFGVAVIFYDTVVEYIKKKKNAIDSM